MCFKNRLSKLLRERGLKQANLVNLTGIPSSLISNYIKGVKSPGLKNALNIANALGVSLETLTAKEESMLAMLSREERILDGFNRLSPEFQDFLARKIDELLEIQRSVGK